MNDNISRQKLIEALHKSKEEWEHFSNDYEMGVWDGLLLAIGAVSALESQPPADSGPDTNVGTNQWIPCSERLPKDGQTVPVTVVLWKEKRILSHATYYTERPTYWHSYDWSGEGFYIHDSEFGECKYENVVAWLNVEPYKGGGVDG